MKIVTLSVIVGFSGWPLLSMAEPGEKPCHHNLDESGGHQHDGEHHGKEPCDSKKGKEYSGDEPCDSKKKGHDSEKPCDKKKTPSLSPADETASIK